VGDVDRRGALESGRAALKRQAGKYFKIFERI
jgi:hypothetical protein